MSKPAVLGEIVNKYTVDVSLSTMMDKFVNVKGVVCGKVEVVVDLAAWVHWSTGLAAAHVLKAMKENMGEITYDWLEEQVAKCDKLREDLEMLRHCVEKMRDEFVRKGASVTLRFVAELREPGEIKTPKIPRDLKPPDEERFGRLYASLHKKRPNFVSIKDWWRECTRGPEGHDWATLGVSLLFVAVNSVFARMSESVFDVVLFVCSFSFCFFRV